VHLVNSVHYDFYASTRKRPRLPRRNPAIRSCLFAAGFALVLALVVNFSVSFVGIAQAGQRTNYDSGPILHDPPELQRLRYRLIGPAWGGRVSRAAGVPGDYRTLYAATTGGGVWKSIDGGSNWTPIFDDQPVSSIGSLAVAPSDPNVIYVGSGEANIRGNVAAGNGIYKSIDGGASWSHVWHGDGQIGAMVVHPSNPDIAFAAVLGHAFGASIERGIYRTKDGGKSWQQILKQDENTGASDVAIDTSDPNFVVAALWQARRLPWKLQSGGPGSGLYVSHDGGDSWTNLKEHASRIGLPTGIWGKVGIAVGSSDPRRLYALIEAEDGGLYRSDDRGQTWKCINGTHLLRQRPFYYSTLSINPANADEVWFPQVSLLRSTDGGKSLQFIHGTHHGDFHDVWFDPKIPGRIIASTDGGVEISINGGKSWQAPRLAICQVYHVAVDSRLPFYVAATIQDIGSVQGPSDSLTTNGIHDSDWYPVGGGEAGAIVSEPTDPNIVYAGEYGGYISRYDNRKKQRHDISIWPENMEGHYAQEMKYRFQMTAPIVASVHEPGVLYHGSNVLFRSHDRGQTWQAISEDLTRNDPDKQKWSGGPITGDNTGTEVFDTIFSIAESPLQHNVLWVGTDDGLVQLTRDGGRSWKNVTASMPNVPEWGTISMIEASHFDLGTAYVVVDAHRIDDQSAYLYKTTNFGESWQRLDAGLPRSIYLHAVREDPKQQGILYIGTEQGVAFSTDDGRTWYTLRLNLPTVAVHDLAVKSDSLVVGTMGRSIWVFDSLRVLRQFSAIRDTSAYVFDSADAIRWNIAPRPQEAFGETWTGEDPLRGAVIYYWLNQSPKDPLTIEIFDAKHTLVRRLSRVPRRAPGHNDDDQEMTDFLAKKALPDEPGINAIAWDLTEQPPDMIQGGKLEAGTDPLLGPRVLPGTYTTRLVTNGGSLLAKINVLPDPRIPWSEKDARAAHDLAHAIGDEISRASRLVERIRAAREQLRVQNELLKDDATAAGILADSLSLVEDLNKLEDRLHNPNAQISFDILAMKGGARLYSQLVSLFDWCKESDDVPAQGMREQYFLRKTELDVYQKEFDQAIEPKLTSVNDRAHQLHQLRPRS
jgi:photosystem II stability/assembly factor-like uncharacterized protein